jgi:hypothetical protein
MVAAALMAGVDPVSWTPDPGVVQRKEARMGRPAKYPEEFRCEAVALGRRSMVEEAEEAGSQ